MGENVLKLFYDTTQYLVMEKVNVLTDDIRLPRGNIQFRLESERPKELVEISLQQRVHLTVDGHPLVKNVKVCIDTSLYAIFVLKDSKLSESLNSYFCKNEANCKYQSKYEKSTLFVVYDKSVIEIPMKNVIYKTLHTELMMYNFHAAEKFKSICDEDADIVIGMETFKEGTIAFNLEKQVGFIKPIPRKGMHYRAGFSSFLSFLGNLTLLVLILGAIFGLVFSYFYFKKRQEIKGSLLSENIN